MEQSRVESALLVTAILSTRRDLDWAVRSRVISHVCPFDSESLPAATDALQKAFPAAGVTMPRGFRVSARSLNRAAELAGTWLKHGISIVSRDEIHAPPATEHPMPEIFYVKGDVSLLKEPSACILNSRTPRAVDPSDNWVQGCKMLFQSVERNRWIPVSSYGRLPYELVSRMAYAKGIPIIVACMDVLPFMDRPERAVQFQEQFRDLFACERALFVSPFPPGRIPREPERGVQRDHLVAALSWRILAGEVRLQGTMEHLLQIAARRGIPVEKASELGIGRDSSETCSVLPNLDSCVRRNDGILPRCPDEGVVEHSKPRTKQHDPKERPGPVGAYQALPLANWPPRGGWLVHYTRACPGPWPEQTLGDYCQTLIDGRPSSAHSAFHTLLRILEERKIRSSRRLIRGAFPCVSFTECLPDEVRDLIRWRAGLIRWSFEPYGIAVRREALGSFNVRPVIYGDEAAFQSLPEDQRFLFQLQKEQGEVWSLEREWRVLGDVDLDRIPANDLLVVVALLDEARVIHTDFGFQVTLSGITAESAKRA
ncbi:MAG: hypothetical protein AB1473_05680 [Thermodesulfobacteriota bacterium]